MDNSPRRVTQGFFGLPCPLCMRKYWPSSLRGLRRLVLLIVTGALLLGGLALWSRPRFAQSQNPLITTPVLALEGLAANSLYYNGVAREWLLRQRPDLLAAADRAGDEERLRAFGQAVVNPKLFRQLDRQLRFDVLLLVGDPTQYRALLDHLMETKDFTLRYVDHTSFVFARGATEPWTPAALQSIRTRLTGAPRRDVATFLALTGAKLLAIRRATEGNALLDEAVALDPRIPEAWSGRALYHMERGEWAPALASADRALSLEKAHLGALSVKTQIFYATKRFNEAYALSQQLLARLPDDPNILFKHAQIAHEAHAYKAEIEVLRKLIALAEKNERPTTGYRLYLAQAYTSAGQAQPAIEAFRQVLTDPTLPADQREFASDSLQRIKSRSGL